MVRAVGLCAEPSVLRRPSAILMTSRPPELAASNPTIGSTDQTAPDVKLLNTPTLRTPRYKIEESSGSRPASRQSPAKSRAQAPGCELRLQKPVEVAAKTTSWLAGWTRRRWT